MLQNVLLKNGHIYKGSYEGWYSVPDEAFLTPEQVTKHTAADGKDTMVCFRFLALSYDVQ